MVTKRKTSKRKSPKQSKVNKFFLGKKTLKPGFKARFKSVKKVQGVIRNETLTFKKRPPQFVKEDGIRFKLIKSSVRKAKIPTFKGGFLHRRLGLGVQ